MFGIERWLKANLKKLAGKDAAEASMELTDRLERLGERLGFRVVKAVWISSRFEEAEVGIQRVGHDRINIVEACLVPIPWGRKPS
jgi:hypothetical protein